MKMLLWILMTWFHSADGDTSDFEFVQEISIMETQFMLSKVGIYIYIYNTSDFWKVVHSSELVPNDITPHS